VDGGGIVFSSSGYPIRAPEASAEERRRSFASVCASSLSRVAESLFATLFPSDCRLCGTPLPNVSRLPVCPECRVIQPIEGALCSVCGERIPAANNFATETELLCGLCRRARPAFTCARAYGSYDSSLRDLIHLLKYERVHPAAKVLGGALAEVLWGLYPGMGSDVLLVPVPLFSRKARQRGFNQSELIAREALKLAPRAGLMFSPACLRRVRPTESQVGLTPHQRRENMRGAFAVPDATAVRDRGILLVDDVLTTGTTAAECARILLRAGATKVWVATVARTLKNNAQLTVRPLREREEEFEAAEVAAAGIH
jgi:ComF family protein